VRLILVNQWKEKADQDLAAAEGLLSYKTPLPYPVCFHCQQASEKYIKAFLTHRQVEFPKSHDIRELLGLVARVDQELADVLMPAAILTPYGVEMRYPGDLPTPTQDEAETALALARQVVNTITPRIEGSIGQ